MSVTKSASEAVSTVFNTIGGVARGVNQTVGTFTSGLDMLDSFITKQRDKQLAQDEVEMDGFYDALLERASIENAERKQEIKNKLQANPGLQEFYKSSETQLNPIIERLRAERQSKRQA